jgi:hypothetical protein
LSGARYPDSTDTPDVSAYIQNAVNDLSDHVGGNFTTTAARDSAFSTWVAQGNTMANGLQCRVAGYPQVYRSGAWHGMVTIPLTTTTADATLYTTTQNVMTLSVPDPMCPYRLRVSGSVLLAQLGAGVTVRLEIRVGGSAINPLGANVANAGGSTLTDMLAVTAATGYSNQLSGAQTVTLTVVKLGGAAGNGYQCWGTSGYNMLAVDVVPV